MKAECMEEYQLLQGYRYLGKTYKEMLMDFLKTCLDVQERYEDPERRKPDARQSN